MQTLRRYFLLIAIIVLALAGSLSIPFAPALALTPTPTPSFTAPADQISYHPAADGAWTAVVNESAGSLSLEQANGGTVTTVFPTSSTVGPVTWSLDGRQLLVVRNNWTYNQPRGTGATATSPIEIWQVEIQDEQVLPARQIFQSPTAAVGSTRGDMVEQILFGAWSPDSRRVVFWLGPLGASILADGLTPYALDTSSGETTLLANWALLNPRYHSWAPDSSALAITVGAGRSAQTNKWLNLVRVGSGQVTTVVSETERVPGIVAWSPQGDLIAYAAVPANETSQDWADLMTWDNPAIDGRRIYLLDPATGQSRRLNDSDAFQDAPLWSDDGSRLYYARRAGDQLQLMAADPATGQAEPVEGATLPLPDYVGYYGQWEHDVLLEQRPGGQLAGPAGEAMPTATPVPPSAEDQAVLEFIFENNPPDLGTLTEDFRQRLPEGRFVDYSRQDVDLTGDGHPEILVTGRAETFYLFAAILRRDSRDALQELFYTTNIEGKYLGQVRAAVEGQRVVLDFLTATGGTGLLVTEWEQRWIECSASRCLQTLRLPLIEAERLANWQLERHYTISRLSQPDDLTVAVSSSRYGWLAPQVLDEGITPQAARRFAGPDTQAIYRRTAAGRVFQLDRRTEVTPGLALAGEFSLQTEETNRLVDDTLWRAFARPDGSLDDIAYTRHLTETWALPAPDQPADSLWGHARAEADVAAHTGPPARLGERVARLLGAGSSMQCRLIVQRHQAGQLRLNDRLDLPCTIGFTHLAWSDVTGDGRAELLLQTIPPEGDVLGERLYIYAVEEGGLKEIGQLDGAINGPDGTGIFWQNSAQAGFTVIAGLPQLDPEKLQSFDDIRLARAFLTYVWDKESGSFVEDYVLWRWGVCGVE